MTGFLLRTLIMTYIKSKYNLLIEKYDEGVLVFNTITTALLLIPHSYWKVDSFVGEFTEDWKILVEAGIWVENNTNEYEMLHSLLVSKKRIGDDIVNVTIVPTYRCNMKCVYCFQVDENEIIMNDLLAYRILEACQLLVSRHKGIQLTWFGGEPLLGLKIMRIISEGLISFCEKNEKRYFASLVTNGTLITDSIADELVKLRISQIQVTLDGLDHDKTRKMKNGESSYSLIVSNLQKIVDKFTVVLRSNVSTDNIQSIHSMIDSLMKMDSLRNKVFFSFYPVTGFEGKGAKGEGFCRYMDLPTYSEALCELAKHVLKYQSVSFLTNLNISSSTIPCEAIYKDTVCFDSYGDVYKCALSMQNHEVSIGNITNNTIDEILDNGDQNGWLTFVWDSSCQDCVFLPLCHSGCIYRRRISGERKCTIEKQTCNSLLKVLYEQRNDYK